MPTKEDGRRYPARKRKLETAGFKSNLKKTARPHRLPKAKKSVTVLSHKPENEAESHVLLHPETASFLQLLEDDAHHFMPLSPVYKCSEEFKSQRNKCVVEFQLPFKELEIKSLEERQWVRRPPPFGKITRCVYVSTKIPIADFPVHKCTCCEETHKSTTKRTTMMASVKAQKELATKRKHVDSKEHHEVDRIMYCGEGCYNRMLFISCSDETCSASDPSLCSNRAIKRREVKSIRVEYIPGPGFGLIANEHIFAGEFIIEYVGEVIDHKECERRMLEYKNNGEVNFYMMELEKNTVIDAKYRSNEARFINHGCDPNSVTQKWNVDGIQRIGIFARRNIAPNEEITINYNFSHFGEAADCKCGSTACTGKIGLKRPKMSLIHGRIAGAAKTKKQVPVNEEPPELKRSVHLSSLALLKSSQMVDSWYDYFGFSHRRLFLCHRTRCDGDGKKNEENDNSGNLHCSAPSTSPASVCSTTTEEDVSLSPPHATPSILRDKKLRKRNWYERVLAGEHLSKMKTIHSFICGGVFDWTSHLNKDVTIEGDLPIRNFHKYMGVSPTKHSFSIQTGTESRRATMKIVHKRLGLSEARARGMNELYAFAKGTSKWNKRIPSSISIDADRIHRLIDNVKGKQIFVNTDQNDLNEDACSRCGLTGELICCDGCPAAVHLNCTNLATVPPDGIPWFCSECTKPKHQLKLSEISCSATVTGEGKRSGTRLQIKYPSRYLRTHVAHQVPSLNKIFHAPAPHVKRRYKKRHKPADRTYRELEHMPLPLYDGIGDSEQ